MRCTFRECEREAKQGWTTCPRHYSAGMNRKQKAMAEKQKAAR